jgi:hypothetical protein
VRIYLDNQWNSVFAMLPGICYVEYKGWSPVFADRAQMHRRLALAEISCCNMSVLYLRVQRKAVQIRSRSEDRLFRWAYAGRCTI